MADQIPDGELLDRYLAGETTEAETAMVRRYFMAHPDAARRIQRYLDRLEGADSRPRVPPPRSWPARGARSPLPASRRRMLAVAAVIVLALGLSLGPRAIIKYRLAGEAARTVPRVYVTAPRERAELLLSDGTRVRLAPGSQLRVAAEYGLDRRDAYLDGLAYFEVAHDKRRPFTVFAHNASAVDVGTQFDVRAYPEDSAVNLVVRSGSVVLSGVGRLHAGDVGQLSMSGEARRWRSTSNDLAWLDGRLAYRDAPLGRVLQDIRRWYDVEARVANPQLAALPFTGVLTEES